ncbi:MAG: DMT family transporter [Candidatus Aquicultorales bacterium]
MDRAKLISLGMIAFSIILAVGGQFLLKAGLDRVGKFEAVSIVSAGPFLLKTLLEPRVLLGLSLYVLSSVSWLLVLSRVELSFAYPLVALGYVVAIALAAIFRNEAVSLMRWGGALMISIGVVLISRS